MTEPPENAPLPWAVPTPYAGPPPEFASVVPAPLEPAHPPPAYPYYQPPPGYSSYGQPVPLEAPRPVRGYAIAAIIGATAVLANQLVEVIAGFPAGYHFSDYWTVDDNTLPVWEVSFFAAPVLLLLVYVIGAHWLWLARSNAQAMRPEENWTLGRGWAWGGWVTPVVALWFPFLIVRDTLRGTRRGLEQIAVGWFAAWLLWVSTDTWVPFLLDGDDQSIRLLGPWEAFSFVLALAAFVLWVQIVVRVTRAQTTWLEGMKT